MPTGLQRHSGPDTSRLPFDPERLTESILALSDMAVLLSARNQEIMYCSQSVSSLLGYKSDDIRAGGWPYIYSLMVDADRKHLERKVMPSVRKVFRHMSVEDKKSCIFNYTARVRHSNGAIVMLALENQSMEWESPSWPSMYMTVLKNITPFASKEKMILTISKKGANERYEDIYSTNADFKFEPFTTREVEIMRMISRGLTSKQMAELLFLSEETVRNHRKNIKRKAGCSKSTELAAFINRHAIL